MSTPAYDSLRQELEKRREEAREEIAKIDRALAALAAPGVAELLELAGHGAVSLPPAPLLTVRRSNDIEKSKQERRPSEMGRTEKVFAALSTTEPKNSLELAKELGMVPIDIRGALKRLYDDDRAERRMRGYYVRKL